MAFRPARTILLAAAALSLPGCTSIFRMVFHGHSRPALASAATPAPATTPASQPAAAVDRLTQQGRAHLAAGNPGLAIEAFQHALGTGETAAPALNGLAVAYARIDRFETAQRLFSQAIALDPTNRRYSENLARLLRSPTLAMRRDADIAAAALPAPAAPVAPAAAPPARGQLVRVSANEYQIVTAEPSAARQPARAARPALALARRAPAKPAAALPAAAPVPAPSPALAEPAGKATVTINPFVESSGTSPAPLMKIETRSKAAPADGARSEADL